MYDKRYEDVIKSCAEVYKLGYELVDGTTPEKYRSIWWTTNKDNKEIIFDVQYKSPDVYNNMMVCNMVTYINDKYGDRGWGGLGPTQELIDAFEMADGTPATQYSQAPADQVFDINTCGIYEGREPRFYANIVFHGSQIFFNADKGAVTVDRYLMDTPDKETVPLPDIMSGNGLIMTTITICTQVPAALTSVLTGSYSVMQRFI